MIVIDIGCAQYGGDSSIPHLLFEFNPDLLLGFDPCTKEREYTVPGYVAQVRESQKAAWLFDGQVSFVKAGLGGKVDPDGETQVSCFDLADLILNGLGDDPMIMKMDAEGAEYILLPSLIEKGADKKLELAWIEWHCPKCKYGWFGNKKEDTCDHCGEHRPGYRTEVENMLNCETASWYL